MLQKERPLKMELKLADYTVLKDRGEMENGLCARLDNSWQSRWIFEADQVRPDTGLIELESFVQSIQGGCAHGECSFSGSFCRTAFFADSIEEEREQFCRYHEIPYGSRQVEGKGFPTASSLVPVTAVDPVATPDQGCFSIADKIAVEV
jgi:hypothetical protein